MILGSKKDNAKKAEEKSKAAKPMTVKRRVLRHIFLPEIFPRIARLGAHFGHFALILALVFRAVRLLPYNHPYLNSVNAGRFGVRDVVGAAASNVVLRRENFDQIAVFGAVLMSLVLLVIQAVVICAYAVIEQAHATSFFETPNPAQDVVFIFLEQVFGATPGIFNAGTSVLGTPVHTGLYSMLSFYSMAMMVLAVFIVVYYIVTVVGEAAISGTPFGRRFNSLWAPIRLVFALGLLVPIAGGLNSAQYITLYVAKLGSGMATQAWTVFSAEVSKPMNVFVKADPPVVRDLVKGIYLTEVCAQTKDKIAGSKVIHIKENVGGNVKAAFSSPSDIFSSLASRTAVMDPYASAVTGVPIPYESSYVHYIWDEDPNAAHQQGLCGKVSLPLTEDEYSLSDHSNVRISNIRAVQEAYIGEVKAIQEAVAPIAGRVVDFYVDINNNPPITRAALTDAALASDLQEVVNASQRRISTAITGASTSLETSVTSDALKLEMTKLGWGGAGLWYTRIGQINQHYSTAVASFPTAGAYIPTEDGTPMLLSAWLETAWNWNPFAANDYTLNNLRNALKNANDHFDAQVTIDPTLITRRYTLVGGPGDDAPTLDWFLKAIFGLSTLFDFRSDGAQNLDPMAGLSGAGNELIENAAWMIGAAMGSTVGAAIPFLGNSVTAILTLLAPFFFLFAMIGFGVGLMLAYLLPLMPFIYFFFAIASWVMEIFEAIVAMPLWALAHLKIDGDGLPGPLASNGYFLLLGIFIRPVLIVFGFIGGLLAFGAGTYFIFGTFDLVVGAVNGDQEISGVSSLIYTVIFAFLVYNLGLTCFKMVDTVPQGILRWIGQGGASQFADNKQDPMQGGQALMFAGVGIMQQANSAMQGVAGGAARLMGGSRKTSGGSKAQGQSEK